MTLGEDILKSERFDDMTKQERELTTRSLYDAHGEPVSDETWERRFKEDE